MAQPSLLYSIKQVELATRARLDELLKPSGLTTLQYTALTVLERRDDMSGAELARNSFVTPQSMADVIAAIERRGYVTRSVDPANRRRHILRLTPAGRAFLADYAAPVAALEAEMLKSFTPADRETFRDYLNRARTALT
ncbi:MarR family winged helix-turn-helix transcriptional regulator [Actinocorallia sp. A-T 12471]|uniref:MarR family winged helix-turn-helix transcriptional regulator n=1 Tax=Actinocorallia sp. A-T 12471 TaxID=3089813 RepID=UPI0029D021EE|nr:MarR family transcriptional regulator [Actinocorallia sp. A-T 12471]MDX6744212.1 MarR family transcriptional regulator [Actinocorallia sp. A-T 12471]